MAGLTGVSHVNLTVTDLAQARWFWTEVMDLVLVRSTDTSIICVDRSALIAIGCRTHGKQAGEDFDECKVGLDHLALSVSDRDALEWWQERFARLAVTYTPIQETEWGWHLNVRAPHGIAIELAVMKPAIAAWLFGPAPKQ